MIYTGYLRLIEAIDFDIKIPQIRVRMQKLEQSECSLVTRRDVARPTTHMCDGQREEIAYVARPI